MSGNTQPSQSLNRRAALAGIAGASVITLIGPGSEAQAAGVLHHGTKLDDYASEGKYKAMWLIKKHPAVTDEEFKTLYLKHAQDVVDTIGSHLAFYRLSFPKKEYLGMNANEAGKMGNYTGPQVRLEWDCIAEMGSSSPRLFDALSDPVMTTPEAAANQADEKKFVDYSTVISLYCEEYTFVS